MTDKVHYNKIRHYQKKKASLCNLNYIKGNRQTRLLEHKHEEAMII